MAAPLPDKKQQPDWSNPAGHTHLDFPPGHPISKNFDLLLKFLNILQLEVDNFL